MTDRPSYWLKVDRATQHFKEIKSLIAPYDVSRPYMVTHNVERKTKDQVYRAYPVEEPDQWIAVVLGDFLFNLRSALDHLRVALVPPKRRWSGTFPIYEDNIWERDAAGNYLER
ncbi:MAG: hypothetical protein LC808_01200 [Actinobacteria bacterium]|nr:hypothetical protein [Actinomycetota bacterium]